MSLSIKNPETHRLVKELASLTGESMTEAITTAVRERLDRIREADGGGRMAERIHMIAVEMRARLPEDFFDVEHGDLLYDEDGLPK